MRTGAIFVLALLGAYYLILKLTGAA